MVLTLPLSGTASIDQGGTNNSYLPVTTGTVYYGDGSKLVGLTPGISGSILTMQDSIPCWELPSISEVITGSIDHNLHVYFGSGDITSSGTNTSYYIYFPTFKRCFIDFSIAYSGSGFNNNEVLAIQLPFTAYSGNKFISSQDWSETASIPIIHRTTNGSNYKSMAGISTDDSNLLFIRNPQTNTYATGGMGTENITGEICGQGFYRVA